MQNLRRFIYKNKKEILTGICFIIFVLVILRFLNFLVKEDSNKKINNERSSSADISTTTSTTSEISNASSKSAIGEKEVKKVTFQEQKELINTFLKYCNDGNTSEAYNLLTDECKEVVFPTLEYFIGYYYNNIFLEDRTCEMQNWSKNTYLMEFKEDILSSGNVNSSEIQDYYTEVDGKLNIQGYIGREKINKSQSLNNIKIQVIQKDIFMEYEIYKLEVYNGTDNKVLLDSLDTTDSMYVTDGKDLKHISYSHELSREMLEVESKQSKIINVKMMNPYITNRNVKSITFDNIINNYEQYKQMETKDDIKESITIKL